MEDTWLFAFHLLLNNMRTADRPQDVLMTVPTSSVHGMNQKKNLESAQLILAWRSEGIVESAKKQPSEV